MVQMTSRKLFLFQKKFFKDLYKKNKSKNIRKWQIHSIPVRGGNMQLEKEDDEEVEIYLLGHTIYVDISYRVFV